MDDDETPSVPIGSMFHEHDQFVEIVAVQVIANTLVYDVLIHRTKERGELPPPIKATRFNIDVDLAKQRDVKKI